MTGVSAHILVSRHAGDADDTGAADNARATK